MQVNARTEWIPLKKANTFVVKHHRHHKERQGAIFSLGLFYDLNLIGVAIVGRPSAKGFNMVTHIEVYRLCLIDDVENGCSILYSSCARIAQEMGFHNIITYILKSESGTSLKAAGWILVDDNCGGTKWNSGTKIKRTNKRVTLFGEELKYPEQKKQRWQKFLFPKSKLITIKT